MPVTFTPSGHPVVPVRIGDDAALPFLLDTGASGTILDERSVPSGLLVSSAASGAVHGALGIADQGRRVVRTALRLGGWTTGPIELTVLALDTLSAQVGTRLAGILGLDVLARGVLELDLGRRVVTLGEQSDPSGPFDGESPIRRGAGGLVLLSAVVNRAEITVLLDTGAAVSVLNPVAASAARLDLDAGDEAGGPERGHAAGIGAGRTGVGRARITGVRMGSIVLPVGPVYVADLPVIELLGLGAEPVMLLGADVLTGPLVVVDFPDNRMHVAREGMR
jgi:predicted aspartyl protease